jgi:predicted transcriptional regulator
MKEEVAEIVAGYVKRNMIAPDQLPGLIQAVHAALSGLGKPSSVPEKLTPAVPIRRSVSDDQITCLDCGIKAKMIRRHLRTAHNMTSDEYRVRWGLDRDYPLVAKNYAALRSAHAKRVGLGRKAAPE